MCLNAVAPPDLAAPAQMDVKLGNRMRPCLDVLVVDAVAAEDDSRTYYPATGAYALTGIHHRRLMVPVPFPVDMDLEHLPR